MQMAIENLHTNMTSTRLPFSYSILHKEHEGLTTSKWNPRCGFLDKRAFGLQDKYCHLQYLLI